MDYLKLIPKKSSIRIFFGDTDEENSVKDKYKKMIADGYKMILTKAKKPTGEAYFMNGGWRQKTIKLI